MQYGGQNGGQYNPNYMQNNQNPYGQYPPNPQNVPYGNNPYGQGYNPNYMPNNQYQQYGNNYQK
jgi:hypothetical protein